MLEKKKRNCRKQRASTNQYSLRRNTCTSATRTSARQLQAGRSSPPCQPRYKARSMLTGHLLSDGYCGSIDSWFNRSRRNERFCRTRRTGHTEEQPFQIFFVGLQVHEHHAG